MIDFLFLDKNTCYFCKNEEISKHFLCESCLNKLDYVDNKFLIGDYVAHSIYFYNKYMANIISDYKFNRNTSLYKVFGSMVKDYLEKSSLKIEEFDYLLPAPSSQKTLNKRGFDHIRLICDYFTKEYQISYLDSFVKTKDTKSQHTLNLEDRLVNLRGSFTCTENLEDKSVLIFDDIITSGNTAKEMIKVLENKGCQDIQILSLSSSHKVI